MKTNENWKLPLMRLLPSMRLQQLPRRMRLEFPPLLPRRLPTSGTTPKRNREQLLSSRAWSSFSHWSKRPSQEQLLLFLLLLPLLRGLPVHSRRARRRGGGRGRSNARYSCCCRKTFFGVRKRTSVSALVAAVAVAALEWWVVRKCCYY